MRRPLGKAKSARRNRSSVSLPRSFAISEGAQLRREGENSAKPGKRGRAACSVEEGQKRGASLSWPRLCYFGDVSAEKAKSIEPAAQLAQRIAETLLRERVIPRFVDSYVIEHGRQALQVHAGMYRDLLGLLHREALLVLTAVTLKNVSFEPQRNPRAQPRLKSRAKIAAFRRKFLSGLTRQQGWTAGDALDFQSDLQVYEDLIARAAASGRKRKPFEAANHPFVDRCAFLLDSSFLEKARVAASRTLTELEKLSTALAGQTDQT